MEQLIGLFSELASIPNTLTTIIFLIMVLLFVSILILVLLIVLFINRNKKDSDLNFKNEHLAKSKQNRRKIL